MLCLWSNWMYSIIKILWTLLMFILLVKIDFKYRQQIGTSQKRPPIVIQTNELEMCRNLCPVTVGSSYSFIWWTYKSLYPWWRHQMETFSALQALCAGNSPVTGEFFSQRPVTRSFEVYFDRRLNKRLSKQSWDRWLETPLCTLWRHCNGDALCRCWYRADKTHPLIFIPMEFLLWTPGLSLNIR